LDTPFEQAGFRDLLDYIRAQSASSTVLLSNEVRTIVSGLTLAGFKRRERRRMIVASL